MAETLAPAKINLFLHVGPVRADGYHPVCSLMEKVSLFDRLALKLSSRPGIRITGEGLPEGPNTIEKAALLLAAAAGREIAADFILDKQIPVAAGLAGGSADAAAALELLAAAAEIDIPRSQLASIALAVGADVPFFLEPGPHLAQGAGEALTPVRLAAEYTAVIATPDFELSTARVYALYDEMCRPEAVRFAADCRVALENLPAADDLEKLAALLANDLEPPAIHLCPPISRLRERLLELGAAGALMSGSGPSVFGLFADEESARAAAREVGVGGTRAWAVRPLRFGMPR